MAQPELCGSEFEHGEEVCGVLPVAGGEASKVFDTIEEPFDTIARSVEHRAEAGFPAAMHHRWDIGRGSSGFDLAARPVGIVGLIRQYDGAFVQVPKQARGDRAITRLAQRQDSSGKPLASTRTWTLVVSPPRERPIQRSGWLFLSSRHAEARATRCCRSSAHCRS